MSSIKPGIPFPPFNIESDELIPWPYAERLLDLDQEGFSDSSERELSDSWDRVDNPPNTSLLPYGLYEQELKPGTEDARSELSTGSNGTSVGAMERLIAEITPYDEPDIDQFLNEGNWIKIGIDEGRQLFSTENTTASILREQQFKSEIEAWISLIRKMVKQEELRFPVKILGTAELKGGNLPTSNIILLKYVEDERMLDEVIKTHFTQDQTGFKSGMFLSKNAELEVSYVLKMQLIIMEQFPDNSEPYCFVVPSTHTFMDQRQERYHYIKQVSCLAIKNQFQELLSISGYPLDWLCNTNETHPETEKPAYIYEELRNMPYYLK